MNDPYFAALRKTLRQLPAAEVEEFVSEVAAHIEERAETLGQEASMRAFGDPRDIARLYLAQRSTDVPVRAWSWRARRAVGLCAKGLTTLAVSLVGYGFGTLLLAMALVKPFTPERIGLWVVGGDDPSFMLGRTDMPVGEEMLGWSVIPIGLSLGTLIIYLTWRMSVPVLRSTVGVSAQKTHAQ